MDCDKTAHHPKSADKSDKYITIQIESLKRTIDLQSWISDCDLDNEAIGVFKKY